MPGRLAEHQLPTHRARRKILQSGLVALATIPLTGLAGRLVAAAETAAIIPPPALDSAAPGSDTLQTVVLAGGCFWGVQAVYQHTKGVTKALSGYAGAEPTNPALGLRAIRLSLKERRLLDAARGPADCLVNSRAVPRLFAARGT